ncbi:site-specific DNA-methyltransferase [Streptomyces sp. SID8499]|nr:site-specific DNA-methyltransferase [Streptomyces sp. SID8499]NED31032.1 site-specific DNA-methyltransferase [Streptomyces sp. SID8499]
MREVLPILDVQADLVVADPPYAETSLTWDRWPKGWPALVANVTSSMWCFGSMRMFLDRRDEFADWKLSQDVVWEKHNGTGFAADRFKRVHEVATHWYRGDWTAVHHDVPRERVYDPSDKYERRNVTAGIDHTGKIGPHNHVRDGSRLTRSVIKIRNMQGRALHPTQKPSGILQPLIEYACPSGGLVIDPFAGSGSTLDAARQSGRRAIGIEAHEPYAEAAARRLDALVLPLEGGAA